MEEKEARDKMGNYMKKAQTPGDSIMVVLMLLLFAIGGLVSIYVYRQFYNQVQITPEFNQSQTTMDAFAAGETVNQSWDYIILAVFIGSIIALMIIGYFIDVHSVFFPLYIISMIIGVGIAYIASYLWQEVSATAEFAPFVASHLPITNHLLNNLAIYFTIIAAMAMIATYAKTRAE